MAKQEEEKLRDLTEVDLLAEVSAMIEAVESDEFDEILASKGDGHGEAVRSGIVLGVTSFSARLLIRMGYSKEFVVKQIWGKHLGDKIMEGEGVSTDLPAVPVSKRNVHLN